MDLSLTLERNAVENDLADAPALGQPVGVARRVVDASIEARARRLFRGLVEGVKGAWRLGWRQAMIAMGGIRKGFHAEQVGEDCSDRTRLRGVAGGILGEGRGDQQGQTVGIDDGLNVRDRSEHVISILRLPAVDEGIRDREADPDIAFGCRHERQAVVSGDLAHDGDPVARWRACCPGAISPVIGNGCLLIREGEVGVVDF